MTDHLQLSEEAKMQRKSVVAQMPEIKLKRKSEKLKTSNDADTDTFAPGQQMNSCKTQTLSCY